MRKLTLSFIFLLLCGAGFAQDWAAIYRENGRRALATADLASVKVNRRQAVEAVQPPLPVIELSATATGSNVVITYLSALNSLVGLVDGIGNGQASGLAFLYKGVNAPAYEIINLPGSGNLLASLAGGRLLRLEKSVFGGAFFSTGSAISFAGIAEGDALTYDEGNGDRPVLANSFNRRIFPYAIQSGRISIGPEANLPPVGFDGLVSFARDSRGNSYALDLSQGGLILRIPAAGQLTSWNRVEMFAAVPGATNLAIDPANDDLYVVAAGRGVFPPPPPFPLPAQAMEGGDPVPLQSRIMVFKNVVLGGARNSLTFFAGQPLYVSYGPLGGITASNGRVYVISNRIAISPYGGETYIPEILYLEAGPSGTAHRLTIFLPAELNLENGILSGLAILH